nr:ASCH domain-containing protein [Pandoraea communis]
MQSGEKPFDYRLRTPYWSKRLIGREYDRLVMTRGYPRADDTSRRLELPWRGYEEQTIVHPHFGRWPVPVFAIVIDVGTRDR